ncbi:MAG: hypothetical protein ACOYMN_02175 [Roseimicrobium sp.]
MKTSLLPTSLAVAATLSLSLASAQPPAAPPHLGLRPIDRQILQLLTNGTFVVGNTGADRLCGGMDDDQLHGDDDSDTITGDGGADVFGSFGTDSIYGEGGADSIVGSAGADSVRPPVLRGMNNDPLAIRGYSGPDELRPVSQLNGDEGADIILRGIESDPFGCQGVAGNALTAPRNPSIICGGTDSDSLKPATSTIRSSGSVNGSFTGDLMEEDALLDFLAGISD